jgi:hypothetical protein
MPAHPVTKRCNQFLTMRQLYVTGILTVLLSCSKQSTDNQLDNVNTLSIDKDSIITEQLDNEEKYLTSTYDIPDTDLDRH